MSSEYQLVPNCTVDDAVGLAQAKAESFRKEPWWTSEFPADRTETVLESMIRREPYNQLTGRSARRHQKVIHVPTGEIVGYSRWIMPREGDWLEAQTPAVAAEDETRYKEQFDKTYWNFVEDDLNTDGHVSEWREKYTPEGPVVVLDYLCCKQEHQRRGVASMLLKAGFDEADKLKIPVTIYAMGEKAREAYVKHGAELLAERHQDLRPYRDATYHTYWLVRQPKQI